MKTRSKFIFHGIVLHSTYVIFLLYLTYFVFVHSKGEGAAMMTATLLGYIGIFIYNVNKLFKYESYLKYVKSYNEKQERNKLLKQQIENEKAKNG